MSRFHDYLAQQLFRGSLPDWQKRPVDLLVAEGLRRQRSQQDAAYVLATAYHETGRFKYMEEIGEGSGRDYGESVLVIRGKREVYYGRGFVQLTWLRNYAVMSSALTLSLGREIDLVSNPGEVTKPEIASLVIWEGMIRGMFTGKNLADYIQQGSVDYVNARRIVNGTDRAQEIAEYAKKFEHALSLIDDDPTEVSQCPLSRSDCPGIAT